MKKNIYFLLFAVASLSFLSSCKKIGIARPNIGLIGIQNNAVSLAATVTAGTIYQLNLSQYGTSSATILQQATGTYIISEILHDAATGGFFYRYSGSGTPKTGSDATEEIVLNVTGEKRADRNSGGCGDSNQQMVTTNTKVTVKLTIK